MTRLRPVTFSVVLVAMRIVCPGFSIEIALTAQMPAKQVTNNRANQREKEGKETSVYTGFDDNNVHSSKILRAEMFDTRQVHTAYLELHVCGCGQSDRKQVSPRSSSSKGSEYHSPVKK